MFDSSKIVSEIEYPLTDSPLPESPELAEIRRAFERGNLNFISHATGEPLAVLEMVNLLLNWHVTIELTRNRLRDELERFGYTSDEIRRVCAGLPVSRMNPIF